VSKELKEVVERLKKATEHAVKAAYCFAEDEPDDKKSAQWTRAGDTLDEALRKIKKVRIP